MKLGKQIAIFIAIILFIVFFDIIFEQHFKIQKQKFEELVSRNSRANFNGKISTHTPNK